MPAQLTAASVLTCPHGGTVIASPAQARAGAPAPLLSIADSFSIAGCPYTLPGPTPSPCVTVVWVSFDPRVSVGGAPALNETSTGLCIGPSGPQGTVVVQSTQSRVGGG
ncbi:MAG TPA: hypothetical protein VGD37_05580 [Kofleriaceae bacterium]|jgi:hypothetical protein